MPEEEMKEETGAAPDAVASTSPPPPPPPPPLTKRRNQYSLEFKLQVARQYAPNMGGRTFDALARKHGLSKSNVMAWVAKRAQLEERLTAANRGGFRLDGCGRKSLHRELEDELERWLRAEAADGRRVRDTDIRAHAMRLFHSAPAASARAFKASSGWLARFKKRKNLVTRRASHGGDDDGAVSGEEEGNDEDNDGHEFTEDSGGEDAHGEEGEEDGEKSEGNEPDAEAVASANADEADERSMLSVERVVPASPTTPTLTAASTATAVSIRSGSSAVFAVNPRRSVPSSAATAPTTLMPPTSTVIPAPVSPAPTTSPPAPSMSSAELTPTPGTPPPASPTLSSSSSAPSATSSPSAQPVTPAISQAVAPEPAPPSTSPSLAPPAHVAPVSTVPAATVPPPEARVVAAWMDVVDRRLDDLTQQIGHLVNGQSLLLGMLQRLVHPVTPGPACGGGGFPVHVPVAAPVALTAQAPQAAIPTAATLTAAAKNDRENTSKRNSLEAMPRTKRRRVSDSSAARTPQ